MSDKYYVDRVSWHDDDMHTISVEMRSRLAAQQYTSKWQQDKHTTELDIHTVSAQEHVTTYHLRKNGVWDTFTNRLKPDDLFFGLPIGGFQEEKGEPVCEKQSAVQQVQLTY